MTDKIAKVNERYKYLSNEEIAEACDLRQEVAANDSDLVNMRVVFCYELMSTFRWTKGKTYRELARVWDVSHETVKKYSAEAYRRFKTGLGDTGDLKAKMIEQLQHVTQNAMQAKQPFLNKNTGDVVYADKPDHKSAIAGIQAIASLCGMNIKKVEHEHTHYDQKSLTELLLEWEASKNDKEKAIDTTGTERLTGKTEEAGEAGEHGDEDVPVRVSGKQGGTTPAWRDNRGLLNEKQHGD